MLGEMFIVCGHYGCGKTNLTLNLALQAAQRGEKNVSVVDMDIVNPYFRSSDYTAVLEEKGVRVISPSLAGSTLDSPSLSAEIYSALENDGTVFIDVGGDDVGAGALRRFASAIKKHGNVRVLYAVNHFRPVTSTARGAIEIMHEIETACAQRVTEIVNTSHLCTLTTTEDIFAGYEFAKKTAEESSLPLLFTAVERRLVPLLGGKVENVLPIDVLVRLPFDS